MKYLLLILILIPILSFSQPTKRLSGNPASNEFPKYNAGSGVFEPGDLNSSINSTQNLSNTGTLDGLDGTQLLRNDNVSQYDRQLGFELQTLSDGTIAWNLDTAQTAIITLTQNSTINNPTNQVAGNRYTIIVKQDATGSRTLSFGTSYELITFTLNSAANGVTIFEFISDGITMYGNAWNIAEIEELNQVNNSNLMMWAAAHRIGDTFRTRYSNETVQNSGDEIFNYYDPSYEGLSLHSDLGTTQPTFTTDGGNSAWSFDGTDDFLSWFESKNMTFVSNTRTFSFFFV